MSWTEDHFDALTELVNIGVGRAAKSLSDMVETRIDLSVPRVEICSVEEFPEVLKRHEDLLDVSVIQDFRGEITGRAALAFPKKSGLRLGQILAELDEEPEEFDLDLMGLITEVGNIVLNGVLGSLGNTLQTALEYSVPETVIHHNIASQIARDEMSLIICDARFHVADSQFDGSLFLVFDLTEIETALSKLVLMG